MSKICPSCGNTLDDNQKFCSICGQNVASVQPQPAEPVQPVQQPVLAAQPVQQPMQQPVQPAQPVQPVQTAQPAQNICPKCGAVCAPGAKFCITCGFNFAAVAQPANPQPQAYQQPQQPNGFQPAQPMQNPQNNFQRPQQNFQPQNFQQPQAFQQNQMPGGKKSSTGMIIAIVLIGVIIIGGIIGAIFLFNRDSDEDEDSSSKKKSSSVVTSSEESSEPDSSEESSEESSEVTKPNKTTGQNDLDAYGIFKTSKFERGYQIPIAQMLYAVGKNDYNEFFKAYPDFVHTKYEELYDTDAKKQAFIGGLHEKYVAKFGEGYKLNCEVSSESDCSVSVAKSLCKTKYGVNANVEEAYYVSYKGVFTNNGKTWNSFATIKCFKIDGEWYVFE